MISTSSMRVETVPCEQHAFIGTLQKARITHIGHCRRNQLNKLYLPEIIPDQTRFYSIKPPTSNPYNPTPHLRLKYPSVHSIVVRLSCLSSLRISLIPFSVVPFFSRLLAISSSIILTPAGVGPRSVPIYSQLPSSDVSVGSLVLVFRTRRPVCLGCRRFWAAVRGAGCVV